MEKQKLSSIFSIFKEIYNSLVIACYFRIDADLLDYLSFVFCYFSFNYCCLFRTEIGLGVLVQPIRTLCFTCSVFCVKTISFSIWLCLYRNIKNKSVIACTASSSSFFFFFYLLSPQKQPTNFISFAAHPLQIRVYIIIIRVNINMQVVYCIYRIILFFFSSVCLS